MPVQQDPEGFASVTGTATASASGDASVVPISLGASATASATASAAGVVADPQGTSSVVATASAQAAGTNTPFDPRFDSSVSATATSSSYGVINGVGKAATSASASHSAFATKTVGLKASANASSSSTAKSVRDKGFLHASTEGTATHSASPLLFRKVVNPELMGDSVDITDSNVFKLTVGGNEVDLTETSFFSMSDYTFDYNEKTLSFSEIATPEIGNPTFSLEDWVTLDIDFGDGFRQYFSGQITTRTHRGENQDEAIEYQAAGVQRLANNVTVQNTTGDPFIEFTVGTTIISVHDNGTNVTTKLTKSVEEAVADMFTVMSSALQANSISSQINSKLLGNFEAQLPETVSFKNTGFFAALNDLVSYERGRKIIWDDVNQEWTFPNVFDAPILTTEINSTQIKNAIFDMTTEGRYTAVRLIADFNEDIDTAALNQDGQVEDKNGNTFTIERAEATLVNGWYGALETDWSYDRVHQDSATNFENLYYWVYRRYLLEDRLDPPHWPGTDITIKAKMKQPGGLARWEKVQGKINLGRGEVITKYPLYGRGNPYIPGDGVGPEEIKLVYYPISWTAPVLDDEGNETGATTTVDQSNFLDEIRHPDEGFEGTAYKDFGVQRELLELVSPPEVSRDTARRRLEALKDVIVEGSIPFGGDPIEQFMNLQGSMLLSHPSKTTGIESTPAIITGYTYNFGNPGESTVELSTDKSDYLRV